MSSCVVPGSYDPVTVGHLSLIRVAADLFDQVTVTVMVNIRKKGALPPEERVRLLQKACSSIPNVRVDRWDGLLAEYMRLRGETCVLRGVRSVAEYEAERDAASINRMLNPALHTVLIPAEEEIACVSSSAVRELFAFHGDVKPFLPPDAAEEIVQALEQYK